MALQEMEQQGKLLNNLPVRPEILSFNIEKTNGGQKSTPDPSYLEAKYQKFMVDYPDIKGVLLQQGYDLFESAKVNTNRATTVPPPESYILGPGDEVEVYLWGKLQQQFTLKIDQAGKIFLPKAGPLQIAGKPLSVAQERIRDSLNEVFANVDVGVNLSKYRSIKVYVLGEVGAPGSYVVYAGSSIFSALAQAEGIKKTGSLRSIQHMRANRLLNEVDLYEGVRSIRGLVGEELVEGDVIIVPPIGETLAIAGAVKKPGIYEIKGKEDLVWLLDQCGGTYAFADPRRVQVEHNNDDFQRVLQDYTLENFQKPEKIKVQDGDLVLVHSNEDLLRGKVSVQGQVWYPGSYQWKSGMKLSALLRKAGGLLANAHMLRADLVTHAALPRRALLKPGESVGDLLAKYQKTENERLEQRGQAELVPGLGQHFSAIQRESIELTQVLSGEKDPELQEGDELLVYAVEAIAPTQTVSIQGAVRQPGEYLIYPDMTIADLIFMAGGLQFDASPQNAFLMRKMQEQDQGRRIKLDLSVGAQDLLKVLQPVDQLYIPADHAFLTMGRVRIEGEVKYPGDYPLQQGDRLYDIILQAGGYTDKAFPFGMVALRSSVADRHAQIQGKVKQLELRDILQNMMQSMQGTDLSGQIPILEALYNYKLEGRLVLDIPNDLESLKKSRDNIELYDRDIISVPSRTDMVQVVGAVFQPGAVLYKQGLNVADYVAQVGGVTRFADKDNVYLVKANGRVYRNSDSNVDIGDAIVVSSKIEKPVDLWTLLTGVAAFIYNMAASISILKNI